MSEESFEIRHISHYLDAAYKRMKERPKTPLIPISSLKHLNNKVWGIQPNKMTVIGARTSVGKTSFCLQLVDDILSAGHPVLYLSFEMKQDELIERLFISRYRINSLDMLKGGIDKYESEWNDFQKYIKNIKFVATDGFGKCWKELDKFLTRLSKKPKVVILDYIQSISNASSEGKGWIDEYIRHFRELCITKEFAGIIVSQLNRTNPESKDKTPQLHQLKGTGYLEEHADVVFLLDWPGRLEDKSDYYVYVAKNRTGRTGVLKLSFRPECYRFEDYVPDNSEYEQTMKELNDNG